MFLDGLNYIKGMFSDLVERILEECFCKFAARILTAIRIYPAVQQVELASFQMSNEKGNKMQTKRKV